MKKNSLKSLIVIFAFSTLSAAHSSLLEEQLLHAVLSNHIERVQRCLETPGIKVNKKVFTDCTVLHHAVFQGYIGVTQVLLNDKRILVNDQDKFGQTALHKVASVWDRAEITHLLLDTEGIRVNEKDMFGMTALHRATENGYTEIANILLKDERILVNEKDKDGMTALHCAALRDRTEIVKLLLAHGKNAPEIPDKQQPTAKKKKQE